MITDHGAAKDRQRRAVLRRRRSMLLDYRRVAEIAIAGRLRELAGGAPVVAAYAAMEHEVHLDEVLVGWLDEGRELALPRVAGPGRLTLHRVDDLDADLRPGTLGIREPVPGAPEVDPASVSLAVVPGVAFDATRHRMGYGGGFYDRLLPRLTSAFAVGVCYEAQMVPHVVVDAHDQRVDAVVTEADVYR